MFFEKYLKNYQVLEKMCSCGNRYPIMCLAFYIGPKEKLTKSREYSVHQRNFLHFTHSMRWFCCSRLLPFITGKHSIFMQSIISIEKLSQRSSFSSLLVLFFSFFLVVRRKSNVQQNQHAQEERTPEPTRGNCRIRIHVTI